MPRSDKLIYSYQLLSQKTPPSAKKKHVCSTCQRSFTTSAHLARHSRVHTRERNHRCPFPGCESRCSRQDNLQQQSVPFFFLISSCTNSILFSYRIHLSPGSRRVSIRANTSRKRASTSSSLSGFPESVTPLRKETPPVDQDRMYDSTPPLAQATLPSSNSLLDSSILGRVSASSYSPDPHHVLPALSSQELSLPLSPPPGNYNYRIVTPNYHDQSLANSCPTFVNHPMGPSRNASHNTISSNNFTYSHSDYGGHSQQSRSTSPSTAMHSRHSLSNINTPCILHPMHLRLQH